MSLLKEMSLQSTAVKYVDVTVAAGASSGTATVENGSKVLGQCPVSNQDQFIDKIEIVGTTLTVTLAANATANNVIRVTYI